MNTEPIDRIFSVTDPSTSASDQPAKENEPIRAATEEEKEQRRIRQRMQELNEEYESIKTHSAYLRWKAQKSGKVVQEKRIVENPKADLVYDHVHCKKCYLFLASSQYEEHKELHIAAERIGQTHSSDNDENSYTDIPRRTSARKVLRPIRWERTSAY